MPFRSAFKKTFTRKRTPSSTPIGDSEDTGYRRSDIEYYEEHEIPKPKYRGRIDAEHKDRLQAFNFASAFGKRASSALSGTFSPRGTHAQSRRASTISTGATSAEPVRSGSVLPNEVAEQDESSSNGTQVASGMDMPSQLQVVDINICIANSSRSDSTPHADDDAGTHLGLKKTLTQGESDQRRDTPFTQQELEDAMSKASLRPRDESILPRADMIDV